MKCGLLGQTLRHSYSPAIHRCLGDDSYALFEKEPQELENFLRHGDFDGLNVTIPYKKAVIPYLDELTDTACKLGAVNTIVRRKDGSLLGHNSDYFGFQYLLRQTGLSVQGKKCLVLGSGGASATVCAVLREQGADTVVISRSGENNYENLALHRDARLLVNTTPLGMYPHNGVSPVSLSQLPQLEGVLDLIYNPARTALLLEAQARGLVAENGLSMLVAQAKESAEYFQNHPISDEKIREIHHNLKNQAENIILIGMPGCGKSTVAAALAHATGRALLDTDAEIEKAAGTSIPTLFAEQGEAAFRQLETEVLARFGKESGLIIATGGGCVTQARNLPLLRQNGTLFWLQRDLSALPVQGRPLSQSQNLAQMYRQRRPLYQAFADHSVDNNGTVAHTVSQILTILEERP